MLWVTWQHKKCPFLYRTYVNKIIHVLSQADTKTKFIFTCYPPILTFNFSNYTCAYFITNVSHILFISKTMACVTMPS